MEKELKAVISYFKSDNVGKYFADCKIASICVLRK